MVVREYLSEVISKMSAFEKWLHVKTAFKYQVLKKKIEACCEKFEDRKDSDAM